jgi:hypothetical protein
MSTLPAARPAKVLYLSEFIVEGAVWPLIPDREYDAVLIAYECALLRQFAGAAKVFLKFRLLDAGEHTGKVVYRAFRALRIEGSRFVIARKGDLHKAICRLLDIPDHRLRGDRVSLHQLKHKVIRINTRTVSKDSKGRPLPESLRYSVVDDLKGIVAG